jgi:hypothetical protein
VKSDPLLRAIAPFGRVEELARLFAVRAFGISESWGDAESSGWRLSRRLWAIADQCAEEVRPYGSQVARGHKPGSLAALARLPAELLDQERYRALARLRARLGDLVADGPAVMPWHRLWEPWREGDGGWDPNDLSRLFENIGYGLEPDPRRGSSRPDVVALFVLPDPRPVGPPAPDRPSVPVVAVAAPVLGSTGLMWPPLWWWVRLLALMDVPVEAAPRLEAHLAFRTAIGRRPGPVRQHLQERPMSWREALGRALQELVGREADPERGATALGQALGLLGMPPSPLDERHRPDRRRGRRARGARSSPEPLGHLSEALDEWLRAGRPATVVKVGALGIVRPAGSVLRALAGSTEAVRSATRAILQLPPDSTYGDVARLLLRRLPAASSESSSDLIEVAGTAGRTSGEAATASASTSQA